MTSLAFDTQLFCEQCPLLSKATAALKTRKSRLQLEFQNV